MDKSMLSCAEYAFSAVAGLGERIGIVRLLGFEVVDIGLFPATDSDLIADPRAAASEFGAALRQLSLRCDNVFYITGDNFVASAPNPSESGLRLFRRSAFKAALSAIAENDIPGMTILPGLTWPHDPGAAWAVCVEELNWRLTKARDAGVELRIEAHAGSIVSTPELAARLCEEVPGLRLTLDASHFELQSITLDRTVTLIPYTGHLHVRAAKPGAIQIRWRDNETDFRTILDALSSVGYVGSYCIEYVPMEKWRCDELDVVTETLATREALAALGIR